GRQETSRGPPPDWPMSEPAASLHNFHDAVLGRIEIDWEHGSVTVDVTRVPGGPARVTCVGVEAFEMGRLQEWGPSVYVNEAASRDGQGGRRNLWMEMRPGAVISIVAAKTTVSPP